MPDLIELADGLKTRPVPMRYLQPNTYVLLAETFTSDDDDEEFVEDVLDGEAPTLLYPTDYFRSDTDADPVVWRFAGIIERHPDHMVARFDGPDAGEVLDLPVEYDALIRTILPDEDHDRWGE